MRISSLCACARIGRDDDSSMTDLQTAIHAQLESDSGCGPSNMSEVDISLRASDAEVSRPYITTGELSQLHDVAGE